MLEEKWVRELAGWRCQPVVTSFYLDVDGRRYPRASDYAPHVEQLFRLARKDAEPLGRLVVEAVEVDLRRIADWLDAGLDRSTTRGVAAFVCSTEQTFEAVSLPLSVRDGVAVARAPDVGQLATVLAASADTLVVVTSTARIRLVRVRLGEAEELDSVDEGLERQVDTDVELGSFERRRAEHARAHLRRAAQLVVSELEEHPVRHLVLSGTNEAVAGLERQLPAPIVARVTARMQLPPSSASDDLVRAAHRLVSEAEQARRAVVLEELRVRASKHAGAVTGLAQTLELLRAGRVKTLLVEEGFAAPGRRCPDCEALVAKSPACPRCGSTTVSVRDVAGPVVSGAFAHHVEVEVCEPGALDGLGGIGALEVS